jgi:hypothetical protein
MASILKLQTDNSMLQAPSPGPDAKPSQVNSLLFPQRSASALSISNPQSSDSKSRAHQGVTVPKSGTRGLGRTSFFFQQVSSHNDTTQDPQLLLLNHEDESKSPLMKFD